MTTYDLAIVGAGPAGLMAARTAAENGLKVVLLERNKEIAPVKRGCGMVLLTLNEPYFGEEKICLKRENGELSFRSQGFSVTYESHSRDLFSWHIFSPGGELVQFGDTQKGLEVGENARTSAVHDKGALLQGLLRDCEELGVKVLMGTNVAGVEKKREKVHIVCEVDNLEASYVIAADGVNSRLAQALEMNSGRTYYGLMKIQGCELEGVEKFDSNTFYSFVTGREHPTYSVLIPLAGQEDGGFRAFTVVFDPEIDYLFSQVNAVMPAIFNPYRAFDLLGKELAGSMEKISKERPDIFKKIQTFSSASMETLMEKPLKAALKL